MVFARRLRASDRVPTSSLADIAFLLLIFFLVTTVFDEEKGLSIVLPAANNPQPVPAINVLQLRVLPDGRVEIRRGESPQLQQATAGEVADIWRTAALENPKLIAAVLTHPAAPYYRMVDVLDALRSAGATRVSLQRLADAP